MPTYLLTSPLSGFSAVSLHVAIFIPQLADFTPWIESILKASSIKLVHFHILCTGLQMESVFYLTEVNTLVWQ